MSATPVPFFSDITPNYGLLSGGISAEVTGTDLDLMALGPVFGSGSAVSWTPNDSTHIDLTVPSAPGSVAGAVKLWYVFTNTSKVDVVFPGTGYTEIKFKFKLTSDRALSRQILKLKFNFDGSAAWSGDVGFAPYWRIDQNISGSPYVWDSAGLAFGAYSFPNESTSIFGLHGSTTLGVDYTFECETFGNGPNHQYDSISDEDYRTNNTHSNRNLRIFGAANPNSSYDSTRDLYVPGHTYEMKVVKGDLVHSSDGFGSFYDMQIWDVHLTDLDTSDTWKIGGVAHDILSGNLEGNVTFEIEGLGMASESQPDYANVAFDITDIKANGTVSPTSYTETIHTPYDAYSTISGGFNLSRWEPLDYARYTYSPYDGGPMAAGGGVIRGWKYSLNGAGYVDAGGTNIANIVLGTHTSVPGASVGDTLKVILYNDAGDGPESNEITLD